MAKELTQHKAGILWNELPAQLKEPSSVKSFTQRKKIYSK